jgi:N utilization substance protein B
MSDDLDDDVDDGELDDDLDDGELDRPRYTGGIGSRRERRERALALLYEAETKERPPSELLGEQVLTPDPFVAELVSGVTDHADDIDRAITEHAQGWTLERMPATDRAILRMAIYELAFSDETPTAVVISEAVELAKAYSTDDSGRFVNGMLAAIAGSCRP